MSRTARQELFGPICNVLPSELQFMKVSGSLKGLRGHENSESDVYKEWLKKTSRAD